MTRTFALAAGAISACLLTAGAHAQSLTLANGSTATFTPNTLGLGASGSVSGTLTQGGASSPFSCTFNPVTGQVGGSPACGQILGGTATGGLSVSVLERNIVSTNISVSSAAQASANARLLDGLATRRIGIDSTVAVQAELQAAGRGDASNVFGAPTYGAWASAGGNFFNDDRLGLERDGHNNVFTAGVDHRVENWMVGIYGGYLETRADLTSLGGDLNSDGWLAGTYVTRVLDDVFSITGAASYADSESHLSRTSAGTRVIGVFDHMEWSASLDGNAFWLLAPRFGITGTAGVSYNYWRDKAYTDSAGFSYAQTKGDNVWGKLAGTATFFTVIVRPYANVTYNRLFTDSDFYTKRDRLTVGGGLAMGQGRLSGVVEVNTLLLNDNQRDTTVGLHLRLSV
jgi:hypothetical protein